MKIKHLLYITLVATCAWSLSGCAIAKKFMKPKIDIQLQKGEQDANLVKLVKDDSTSSGRDMITITENDPELMEKMMEYWWMIFVFVMGKEHRDKKRLIKEKKFYKDRFLAIGVKNEEELKQLRKQHDG